MAFLFTSSTICANPFFESEFFRKVLVFFWTSDFCRKSVSRIGTFPERFSFSKHASFAANQSLESKSFQICFVIRTCRRGSRGASMVSEPSFWDHPSSKCQGNATIFIFQNFPGEHAPRPPLVYPSFRNPRSTPDMGVLCLLRILRKLCHHVATLVPSIRPLSGSMPLWPGSHACHEPGN